MSFQRFLNGAKSNGPSSPLDFDCVRDTLRYIESDLHDAPEYANLRAILATALAEIDRVERTTKKTDIEYLGVARFVPLRL